MLTALPAAWPAGSVRGLRARGGATVDIEWAQGRATRITLKATRTRELTVRSDLFEDGQLTFRAVAGRRYTCCGQGCRSYDPEASSRTSAARTYATR